MSEGKFDAAIRILGYYSQDLGDLTDSEVEDTRAAIRLLEAAGKVDKDEAQTFLRAWYEENGLKVPGEREAYNHIRRFLAALPDAPEGGKG